jgi:hypothetical protein
MYLAACHRARMGREKLTEGYALKRRSILPLQGTARLRTFIRISSVSGWSRLI